MKVILRPRQMGKTSKLIEIAANTDSTILCVRHAHIRGLVCQAKELGYAIPRPMSVASFLNTDTPLRPKRILVDNAEWVLSDLLRLQGRSELTGLAMTGVNDINYDEQRDYQQWEEFRKSNKNLTFVEFVEFKYNIKQDGKNNES